MPMLKKEHAVPGAKVIVNDIIRDGITGWMAKDRDDRKEFLSMTHVPGGFFNGGYNVGSGTVLEIVKKPRKTEGINTVRVRVVGQPQVEGEVFWCELRASTTLLVDDTL